MSKWITEEMPNGVLVRPLDDIVPHTYTEVCVCAPRVDRCYGTCTCQGEPKLAMRKVIVHHAMDGRR